MNDQFWDHVCGTVGWWHALAVVDAVFLLLLGFSLLFVRPGTGSFVAAVVALVVIVTYLVLYAAVRYKCARRERG